MDAKEDAYISLLKKIVTNIAEPIDVVFDAFNKKDFEKKIILSILPMANIEKIAPGDSVREPGLQFVDNICGTTEPILLGNPNSFFYSQRIWDRRADFVAKEGRHAFIRQDRLP